MADYEALLETSDVLASRDTLKMLERSLYDEKNGRLWQRGTKGQWTPVRSKGKGRAA